MHFYAKDKEGNIQPKHFVKMAKNPNKNSRLKFWPELARMLE